MGVNDEGEREPQGGEGDRPLKRREGGLTSTSRQQRSWQKRGGWGKVTMISRGVEIAIFGGREDMLRVLFLWRKVYHLYLIITLPLFWWLIYVSYRPLMTHSESTDLMDWKPNIPLVKSTLLGYNLWQLLANSVWQIRGLGWGCCSVCYGADGPNKTLAMDAFRRCAWIKGLGHDGFFGIPCSCPRSGLSLTYTLDMFPSKIGGNKWALSWECVQLGPGWE